MDMHKKIIAFAMSLDMEELKDNRLLLLTANGFLSALPVFSDDTDLQAKTLYQFLTGAEKASNENFIPDTNRHMIFDANSILLKDIQWITSQGTQHLGSLVLSTASVIAVSIGNFKQPN